MATSEAPSAAPRATTGSPRCSFCGKSHTEVAKLVAGPGVYICDVCVGLAGSVIEQSRGKAEKAEKAEGSRGTAEESGGKAAAPRLPMWEALTDEQLLDHIPRVAAVAEQVEENLRSWVQELRRRGVTWVRIGQVLGVSRQSAWERFSGEE